MYGFALKLAMAFNSIKYLGASRSDVTKSATTALDKTGEAVVESVLKVMKIVMPIIFALVTVIGVAYGVILGINYAKAEDNEKREEAKKRLVAAIIGFGIAIIISIVLWILANQTDLWKGMFA